MRNLQFKILFLLCSITHICYSGKQCISLPYELDILPHAIDITKYDFLPTNIANTEGLHVFDFTCDKGKKWTNPYAHTLVNDLPDQIESITPITSAKGILESEIEVFHTYQDIKVSVKKSSSKILK